MENRSVTWEDIEIYKFRDFRKTEKGYKPSNVELKNKEVLSIDSWINRIEQHISKNKHEHIYEALKDYWTRNNNGNKPEFSAYCAYARKDFNNPICAGFKEFKEKGLFIEKLGYMYPWQR